MLTFKSLSITDFKSFVGAHTFDFFSSSPGLYYITGDNRTAPALGANGCGKTTLLDAVCWTLYGKTTPWPTCRQCPPVGRHGDHTSGP